MDEKRPVRVRIAPSPTGNCHVGTARNALYNLLFARQRGGAFILRSDDTDARRSTLASEQGVLEGLRWLGLYWDEGPDVGGPYGPYRQSQRRDLYAAYARRLMDAGRAYHCFCTPDELEQQRQQAQQAGVPFKYDGRCRLLECGEVRRRLRAGTPSVMRFAIEPRVIGYADLVQGYLEQDGALLGDPVIIKSDGQPTYSFATVVDEIEMKISHVLRGAEHINNTFLQLEMYAALDAEPPAFGHFSLLLNPDRSKISKRTGATFVGEFRQMGYLPEAMINHLALSGWNPGNEQEFFTWDDLLACFSLERCGQANAIFDRTRLLWLNGCHIRRLDAETLARRAAPYLIEAGLLDDRSSDGAGWARLTQWLALEQERLKTLADAPDLLRFFFEDPPPMDCIRLLQTNRFARHHSLVVLRAAFNLSIAALSDLDNWVPADLESALDAQIENLGWSRADLLMPLRVAVSGREATPPLFETLACLGRAATLRRLNVLVNELAAA